MRILVACLGNNLRGDDGVGVEIARRLRHETLPPEVEVEEFGIGGVHLVQSLMAGEGDTAFGGLIVVDCADRQRLPGTVMVIAPEITDPKDLSVGARHDFLADMHYTNPERALALAQGLHLLPERVVLVGIQPADTEQLSEEMSEPVVRAIPIAAAQVRSLWEEWLAR